MYGLCIAGLIRTGCELSVLEYLDPHPVFAMRRGTVVSVLVSHSQPLHCLLVKIHRTRRYSAPSPLPHRLGRARLAAIPTSDSVAA